MRARIGVKFATRKRIQNLPTQQRPARDDTRPRRGLGLEHAQRHSPKCAGQIVAERAQIALSEKALKADDAMNEDEIHGQCIKP